MARKAKSSAKRTASQKRKKKSPGMFESAMKTVRKGARTLGLISKTTRGRSQDRKRVAGGQDYEVRYEAKKIGKSKRAVKRTVKSAGPSRRKVEKALQP
jgi:hypothetical protein